MASRKPTGWRLTITTPGFPLLLRMNPISCTSTRIRWPSSSTPVVSSDRPKGVMLTHRNVYLHALSLLAAGQTSPVTLREMCCTSVLLHTIPLFHANGWGTAHTITVVGGTHIMIHQFTPAEVFRLIERERVTTCCMVPTMVRPWFILQKIEIRPEQPANHNDRGRSRLFCIGKRGGRETWMFLHLRLRTHRNLPGAGEISR